MEFVVGTVVAKPGKRAALMEAFTVHAIASRNDPGCIYFEVAPLPETAEGIILAELYETVEAHRAHQGLAHFAEFQAKLPALAAHIKLHSIVTENADNIDVRLD